MSTLKELIEVTRPYWPLVLGLVVYPMVAAWLNWVLWFDTPEKWDAFAAQHPKWAFAIRLFRLANPHLRPVLLAWRAMADARRPRRHRLTAEVCRFLPPDRSPAMSRETLASTPADVLAGRALWCVVEGDAADTLPSLPDGCIDAVVTDPPAGIGFMGASWDGAKGGRAQWVAWLAGILADARRATRDGGRAVVWGLPRTAHWTGCAVEDAGWTIENVAAHLFGTGWPKGAAQLKPAMELWSLARNGKSTPLNVDACRVGTTKRVPGGDPSTAGNNVYGVGSPRSADDEGRNPLIGRWPPNALLSHAAGCACEGTRRVKGDAREGGGKRPGGFGNVGADSGSKAPNAAGHADPDGTELVPAWVCVEGCPVAELAAQSGERTSGSMRGRRTQPKTRHTFGKFALQDEKPRAGDTGTAARFFPQLAADDDDAPWALFRYIAKPSRAEKNRGCDNTHSTVKSIALMSWLLSLVTRPGEVILDPFGGSGTTGVAAILAGRRVILCEREPEYAAIARARCEAAERSLVAALPTQPALFATG